MKLPRNTKESGVAHFVIFQDKRSRNSKQPQFVAVCLDFDIVETGNNPKELTESILEAGRLHLETVIKDKLDDSLLNRRAPKRYWDIYYSCLAEEIIQAKKPSASAMSVNGFIKLNNRELIAA